jgi:RNA polymerase sigma-70 factor (ECF subfamily)
MLGSLDDAEDAVQEALAKAWRRRDTFDGAGSVRAWLYRIATNTALDALDRRRRANDPEAAVVPAPSQVLDGPAAPLEQGPEGRYSARESVSLAFLRTLQLLPPRQRAVLLLRDVLAFHASEVAAILGLSVPAVNSALQRARARLDGRDGPSGARAGGAAAPRRAGGAAVRPPDVSPRIIERFTRAWEAADIAALVRMLRDDARLAMPPRPAIVGARAIAAFLEAAIFAGFDRRLLVPVSANGAAAFVVYAGRDGGELERTSLLVPAFADLQIARIDAVVDPRVLDRFAPARTLADQRPA